MQIRRNQPWQKFLTVDQELALTSLQKYSEHY